MSFVVRQAWAADLDRLVELAVGCQRDPNRSCAYLSRNADAIRAELVEIDGADHWTDVTWVALDDQRNAIGWVAAESDASIDRVWWFGPFVAEIDAELLDTVLDGLFRVGRRSLSGWTEHELVVDARSAVLERFARRHGFVAGDGSVALRLDDLDIDVQEVDAVISAASSSSEAEAIALHDKIFPGTHATGEYLFGLTGERHDRWVARRVGEVVGYVATEMQHDGSIYVDYLGVAVAGRGQGIGRALVATALRARADEATHAHLTVRVSNVPARRLYASLGFVDDVVLVPHRIGFTLD